MRKNLNKQNLNNLKSVLKPPKQAEIKRTQDNLKIKALNSGLNLKILMPENHTLLLFQAKAN